MLRSYLTFFPSPIKQYSKHLLSRVRFSFGCVVSIIWEQFSWVFLTQGPSGSCSHMLPGVQCLGVCLGLEDVLLSWPNHTNGRQVHAKLMVGSLYFSSHGTPIGLLVYPLGMGPGFLQEKLTPKRSKRKLQCLVAGQCDRMSFLSFSVC